MSRSKIFSYKAFRRVSIQVFKFAYMFLIIFSTIFYIFTAVKTLDLNILDPWTAIFDLLLGITIVTVFIVSFLIAHTRVGTLLTFIALAFWAFIPTGSFIFNDWNRLKDYFAQTYYLSLAITIFYLGVFLLGVLNFIGETVSLIKNKRSGFWGPWFSSYKEVRINKLSHAQKRKVKIGVVGVIIAASIIITGMLPFFNAYRIPIEIIPKDYQVKFNFWAPTDLDGFYNASIRQELNEHQVNLDLTFSRVNEEIAQKLVDFETAMPNITYRITIAPPNLALLPDYVKNATNILMAHEKNGTIDQWRGFAFNIETNAFKSKSSFDTFEDGINLWNEVFDWVESKSLERNKTIEMECISYVEMAVDTAFDTDMDLQKGYGYPAFSPERFTTYAPMLYRCQFEGNPPNGYTPDPLNDWFTSYRIYNPLYTLRAGIPERKLGVYLGITNLTCYSRDLPQPEPHSWPEGETNGFMNLARDILIAKHFGIKEVTLFILNTYEDSRGFSMGGVFDSYGIDFLDKMNSTVNTNPPEKFYIYYDHEDALRSGEKIRFDWYWDTSRPIGLIEIGLFWFLALFLMLSIDNVKTLNKLKARAHLNAATSRDTS
ncbi:MAG: hypothetical protein ACTSVI_04585 [Promethearchaeota archaeon]